MSEICKFCNKSYSSKYNLNKHIKTNKKCLELRGKENDKFDCIGCCKFFTAKYTMEKHIKNCENYKLKILENKYVEQIKILESKYIEQIKILESKISKKDEDILKLTEKIASIPKTINNNTNTTIDNSIKMNMIPYNTLSDNFIKYTFMNNFNEHHLLEGQSGVAKFVSECILTTKDKDGKDKKLMVCTDPSRRIFKTIDNSGEISKDIEAKKFTERIYEPVKEVSDRIVKELNNYYNFLVENSADELDEDDDQKIKLDVACEKISKAFEKQIEIINLPKDNSEFSKKLSQSLTI